MFLLETRLVRDGRSSSEEEDAVDVGDRLPERSCLIRYFQLHIEQAMSFPWRSRDRRVLLLGVSAINMATRGKYVEQISINTVYNACTNDVTNKNMNLWSNFCLSCCCLCSDRVDGIEVVISAILTVHHFPKWGRRSANVTRSNVIICVLRHRRTI